MNRSKQTETHERPKRPPKTKGLSFIRAGEGEYKEVAPGASMKILWGEETGPHGEMTKFVPGFDAGMHTHTHDARIVVIKGAYLYKDAHGEKRVGPGDFLVIPGGTKHWSGGDANEGALFYQESSGKFDLVPTN